jgi:hypothetical protein
MATMDGERVRLGEPLSLDTVAQRLAWNEDAVAAHLAERKRWASETIERLSPIAET